MKATKVVLALLAFLLKMAERDANKAAERQKQFKKQRDASSKVLREERDRLRAKADKLSGEAATAAAQASIGCNRINEEERNARTLARQLAGVVEASKLS